MTIFYRTYIFCLLMRNAIKNKNFWFSKKLNELRKDFGDKIVHLKNIYKFTPDYFLIGHVIFVLFVKNVIKNEKFDFHAKIYQIQKTC